MFPSQMSQCFYLSLQTISGDAVPQVVDWTLPDGITVDTLSQPIKVLFQGQRALIYTQLKGEVG